MASPKQQNDQGNAELIAKMIEDIDIAMLTTIGPNGYLVSRPLSTQAAEYDGERIWFFTEGDSPKVGEIKRHPKINIAYASKDKNTYVSVAGDAKINRDQSRIDQFWNDALKAFFPKGKNDPNLALIEVQPRTAEYWDGPGSAIGKAISFVVARVTGNDDVMGKNRIVNLADGSSRKPPANDTRPKKTAAGVKKAAAGLSGRGAAGTKATNSTKKSAAKKTTASTSKIKKTAARKSASKSASKVTASKAPKRTTKKVTR